MFHLTLRPSLASRESNHARRGANNSRARLNPLSMLTERSFTKVAGNRANNRAQGKRRGNLGGRCKRALGEIAARATHISNLLMHTNLAEALEFGLRGEEGFVEEPLGQTQRSFAPNIFRNYSREILPKALQLVSLLRR